MAFLSTFLDKYPAKSDIIGLSDATEYSKLTFIICYARFFIASGAKLRFASVYLNELESDLFSLKLER